MSDVSNGGGVSGTPSTPRRKLPVSRDRRWLVVARRPRAAAHFLGPFTFDRACAEAQWQSLKWEDAAVAVYELREAA